MRYLYGRSVTIVYFFKISVNYQIDWWYKLTRIIICKDMCRRMKITNTSMVDKTEIKIAVYLFIYHIVSYSY